MELSIFEKNEQRMMYRSFNITVIKKLWEIVKGDLGTPVVGGEYDADNIYKVLSMSKEKMRGVVRREYNYDENKIMKQAISIRNRSGISIDYLCGYKLIKVPGFTYEMDELEEIYDYKELFNSYSDSVKENLKDKTEEEIKELVDRARRLNENHKKKMQTEIDTFRRYARKINQFSKDLQVALEALVKTDLNQIKDEELYKLMYFILYSKKYDEYSVASIYDIIKILDNTGYDKLKQLAPETLDKYRQQLERHIQLLDAIKTIKNDKEKFLK